MSTYTITSTKLTHVFNQQKSNWASDGQARQGQYTGNSNMQVGVIQFAGLKTAVNWRNMDISNISLAITFGGSGGDWSKTIGLYRGTHDDTSSSYTGDQMRGDAMGELNTSPDIARNATLTFDLNNGSMQSLFQAFVAYIKAQTANTVVIYYPNDKYNKNHSYTDNYLNIESVTITITYSQSGNGKPAYIGVGGKAHKVTNIYIGVGGKARKVRKAYIGVGGKAKLIYER